MKLHTFQALTHSQVAMALTTIKRSLVVFEKRIPACFNQFRGDFVADLFRIMA